MRVRLAGAVVASIAFAASPALAQQTSTEPAAAPEAIAPAAAPPSDRKPDDEIPVDSHRRSGFVIGLVATMGITDASGTPIKFTQRASPVDTGWVAGGGSGLFLGGAFTDWFVFHVGASGGSASKGNLLAGGGEFTLGVEAWPLFSLGGVWEDIGIGGDFGVGGASVQAKDTQDILADGAACSVIRANVFWDALRLGHFNVGPYGAFQSRSNETYSEQTVMLGARLVFYGGPLRRETRVRSCT